MFATSNSSVLADSLQQIKDAISDFRNSSVERTALNVIKRIVDLFDTEPLAEFLISALPTIDFREWWDKSERNTESISGGIEWPNNIEERVATQVELCRAIEKEHNVLIYFTKKYCYPHGSLLSEWFAAFATKLLDPLVRDISRLIECRQISPILHEAMRDIPASNDNTLDKLILEACRKFKDPAPQSLQDAVEKLWDSFERIKTLEDPQDKKKSINILLEKVTEDLLFREHLNREATDLTAIGNKFQIRHFETDKISLNQKQLEYLFHRLYSLIRFLLLARNRKS